MAKLDPIERLNQPKIKAVTYLQGQLKKKYLEEQIKTGFGDCQMLRQMVQFYYENKPDNKY